MHVKSVSRCSRPRVELTYAFPPAFSAVYANRTPILARSETMNQESPPPASVLGRIAREPSGTPTLFFPVGSSRRSLSAEATIYASEVTREKEGRGGGGGAGRFELPPLCSSIENSAYRVSANRLSTRFDRESNAHPLIRLSLSTRIISSAARRER